MPDYDAPSVCLTRQSFNVGAINRSLTGTAFAYFAFAYFTFAFFANACFVCTSSRLSTAREDTILFPAAENALSRRLGLMPALLKTLPS
jgi:hypothetical protein